MGEGTPAQSGDEKIALSGDGGYDPCRTNAQSLRQGIKLLHQDAGRSPYQDYALSVIWREIRRSFIGRGSGCPRRN